MPKLNIKSIQMRNFGTVRNASVKFPERGFILVNGQNRTGSGRFESIGSGKTLLGEALSRTLFNVPGRFTRFSGYSYNGEGNTYVRVDTELENQSLVVEIGYKCAELSKGGEGLRFTLGNQTPVMYGNIQDTRKELLRMFGMQTDVAGWTVYIDGSQLNFDSLAESKAVNLLMGALNQPPWTEYQRKAVKVLDKFKTATETAEGVHNSVKLALSQAQLSLNTALAELTAAEKTFSEASMACLQRQQQRDANRARLTTQKNEFQALMRQLRRQIEEATNAEAAAYHEAETMAQRCASIFAEAQRGQSRLEREYGEIQKAHEELKSAKQTAITEYTQKAYAQVNAERVRLQNEIRRIEKSNGQAKKAWDVEEKKRSKAVDTAQLEFSMAETDFNAATAALDREVNVPCTCPLPGCGKPWPRTNEKQVVAARNRVDACSTKYAQAQTKLTEAKQAFEIWTTTTAVQEEVPVVPEEQPIPPFPQEKTWQESIGSHALQVMALHQKLTEQILLVALTEAQSKDAKQKVDSLKEASKIPVLSQQYEEHEQKSQKVTEALDELNEQDRADVPDIKPVELAKVRVNERQSTAQQHETRLAETAQEVSDCHEAQKIASYWVEAFGATGIPNMIINEAVAPLNAVSKRISLRMTGGLLEVSYDTKRQLNSGEETNELMITAVNKFGSAQVAGSSKGEAGLLDLIIAETIAEVGNVAARVGYRWYDEIARSQDQTVRRSIFSYLKELANNVGILTFVVDHSTEVASYANHVLLAEKTNENGTVYTWQ